MCKMGILISVVDWFVCHRFEIIQLGKYLPISNAKKINRNEEATNATRDLFHGKSLD